MSERNSATIKPEVETHTEVNPSEGRPGHFPALPIREWVTYSLLAAALAVTNIYTTLLTGWGDGGSLIAVVAAVGILSAMRRRAHIQSLNLGQTLASAGGTVGFAATSYAAVRLALPEYEANLPMLLVMFTGMALVGVVIGTTVRKQMVKYYFPSGTACAVVQRTVTNRSEDAKRPVRMLGLFGAIGAVWSTLTTITFTKGSAALLKPLSLGSYKGTELGVGVNPVFYGIGIVVGPRVGLGMLIGTLAGPFVLAPAVESGGLAAHFGDFKIWSAIAVLTLPTFATLLFAFMFRTPPIVPPGFRPGVTDYKVPSSRNVLYTVAMILGLGLTAGSAQALFDLPWHITIIVVAACFPLAIMNGRVTGETDINPVRLVIIVILTLFALAMSTTATMLLGMTLIATMMAGMAVDMMQDYRTGYLVDANPTHQTTVQFIGVLVGVAAAVPFILFLDSKMGFGPGTSFPAPGPQIYAGMIKAFTGGAYMSTPLIYTIIGVSVAGCAYAFLTVWPKTALWVPSLFGIGIGMLLPVDACVAIFLGGMIKWITKLVYTKGLSGERKAERTDDANNDTMLAGSALFAAAAIMAVVLIVISAITGVYHIAH